MHFEKDWRVTRDLSPPSCVGLAGFDCPSCRCFLSASPSPLGPARLCSRSFLEERTKKVEGLQKEQWAQPRKESKAEISAAVCGHWRVMLGVLGAFDVWGGPSIFALWYPHSHITLHNSNTHNHTPTLQQLHNSSSLLNVQQIRVESK